MHKAQCLRQECDQTDRLCGRAKFSELFDHVAAKLGLKQIEVFQHLKINFTKYDGSNVMSTHFQTWKYDGFILGHQISAYQIYLEPVCFVRFSKGEAVWRKGAFFDASFEKRAWEEYETKFEEKFEAR